MADEPLSATVAASIIPGHAGSDDKITWISFRIEIEDRGVHVPRKDYRAVRR